MKDEEVLRYGSKAQNSDDWQKKYNRHDPETSRYGYKRSTKLSNKEVTPSIDCGKLDRPSNKKSTLQRPPQQKKI
jgi:hypothetical protein